MGRILEAVSSAVDAILSPAQGPEKVAPRPPVLKLRLQRDKSGLSATLGRLYVNGEFECHTLEDVVRPAGEKVAGRTAIPAGTYRLVLTHSPRFGRILPLLVDVPNYSGVRLHPGNTAADTDGCILPGTERDEAAETILHSRAAFDALFAKLDAAWASGVPMQIEVVNA